MLVSYSFYIRLEASFSPELFTEITTYLSNVDSANADSDDGKPRGGEVAAKFIMLACASRFCSSAAGDFISDLVCRTLNIIYF